MRPWIRARVSHFSCSCPGFLQYRHTGDEEAGVGVPFEPKTCTCPNRADFREGFASSNTALEIQLSRSLGSAL